MHTKPKRYFQLNIKKNIDDEKIREVISSLKMAGLESDDIDLETLKSILNCDEARKIILDSINQSTSLNICRKFCTI